MFGLEPGKSFRTSFVGRRTSAIRRSVAGTLLNHFRSHGLDCVQKIYRGEMNKDSEALIFLVLFSSSKKELELVPLKRDGKAVQRVSQNVCQKF